MYLAICLLAAAGSALAAEPMEDLAGTPFFCQLHPWLEGRVLPVDSQASYAAAEVLGMDVVSLGGIELHWPKSDRSASIFAGQYGDMLGSGGRQLETSICIALSDSAMRLVELGRRRQPGFLSKLAVWPDSRSADANLIVLTSFSDGYEDSQVIGFSIAPDGTTSLLDTGNAHTQWGEFQLADLDDNGSYELLCYRNLDGMLGGLSYRSVRGYDSASHAYVPAPEQHHRFFELERDWLDWVIDTRSAILANPAAYISEEGSGAFYQASYNGVNYGFDSILFIDNAGYDRETATQMDTQTREAFARVRRYRDELNRWLAGGEQPATWGAR